MKRGKGFEGERVKGREEGTREDERIGKRRRGEAGGGREGI